MSTDNVAIRVEKLKKVYKLYDKPVDRLKESLHPFRKTYHQDFYALNDVSFEIKKGETVGVIGKNGSGKSTLLKIVTGVLQPTSGTIQVNGKISALLELGAGFNPEMTGIENIYLNGNIMGYTKEEMDEKLDDILAFADIGDFVYQPVKMYSSGMFARLAFAVSINVNPDILIVDEALAVGDTMFQLKCYRKFNEFREQGKTILFVTHSMDTVIRYCTSAILINEGVKVQEGTPKEMVDLYKKITVNLFDEAPNDYDSDEVEERNLELTKNTAWKSAYEKNPEALDYGTKAAEIIDYGVFDSNGRQVTDIYSSEYMNFKMRVRFNQKIIEPIFALTIKDMKGYEVTGTNTMVEEMATGTFHAGDEVIIAFSQTPRLNTGTFVLSLGCTGFNLEEFVVYHRLYDVLVFQVNSFKNTVGIFDMNSTVKVNRIKQVSTS